MQEVLHFHCLGILHLFYTVLGSCMVFPCSSGEIKLVEHRQGLLMYLDSVFDQNYIRGVDLEKKQITQDSQRINPQLRYGNSTGISLCRIQSKGGEKFQSKNSNELSTYEISLRCKRPRCCQSKNSMQRNPFWTPDLSNSECLQVSLPQPYDEEGASLFIGEIQTCGTSPPIGGEIQTCGTSPPIGLILSNRHRLRSILLSSHRNRLQKVTIV